MAKLPFWKYHGAGNDFILIVEDEHEYLLGEDELSALCRRRFGVGADGFIRLRTHPEYAFEMHYYNADGKPGSLCGNGSRCAVALAARLGWVTDACTFLASDGPHAAILRRPDWVEVKMGDVGEVERGADFCFLDTGSPHYVHFVSALEEVDVVARGREIRFSERFREAGTNVNFVERRAEGLKVATYERGVEDETLSCGTGVTASALAAWHLTPADGPQEVAIRAKGGALSVRFEPSGTGFRDIWLCGPAAYVFEGRWPL